MTRRTLVVLGLVGFGVSTEARNTYRVSAESTKDGERQGDVVHVGARQNSRVPGALLPIQRSTQSVYLPRRIERGAHVDQCTSCTPVNHQTVQRPINERKRCRLFMNLRWGSFSPVFIPSGMTWRVIVQTKVGPGGPVLRLGYGHKAYGGAFFQRFVFD